MCGLCGVLGGGPHWTDGATGVDDPSARRRERLGRVATVNRVLAHYALRSDDWQGSAYLLSNRTGKTEIVDNLTHLWQAAERMIGRGCDPLDPALIERLGMDRLGRGG
ncbi:hypothetical protein N825_09150 [Skermanella stibiiresistens SB22]|uniref:Uncharacterized protein n=1 Tax=Skermanella stibiiresistens SB22 TaxID=1385369 RepID=W9GYR5_9PROT|nr:hypothetical protein [Skermanella stibiiresistens]EWY37736.1 hypothetical protein N825_09150 [Skermanella stibiiresistens SB22]